VGYFHPELCLRSPIPQASPQSQQRQYLSSFNRLGASWILLQQAACIAAVLVISSVVFHFYEGRLQRMLRNLLFPVQAWPIAEPAIANRVVSLYLVFAMTGRSEGWRNYTVAERQVATQGRMLPSQERSPVPCIQNTTFF
jgi:hypothetical protein